MDRIERLEKSVYRLEGDLSDIKVILVRLGTKLDVMNTKFDIIEVRAFVERTHTDIYKWVATTGIGGLSFNAAIYFGIQHLPE